MEWLTVDESLALLTSVPIGQIVFTDRALPAIVPVNHTVDDGCVVIRTTAGSTLAAAVRHAVVAYEADRLDYDTRTGWSVVVLGEAERVDDPGEITRLTPVAPQPWAPGTRDHLVRITIAQITGRRIDRAPQAASATNHVA